MANRGYKLQEFVAHASDVKCLNIGKKSCRMFITGGEDRKVNLWAIGKPTSLLSLSGHTSSVESVTFDPTEVLVLAGSSNGTIKLWDLEETKVVRALTAHRSSCTSVGFHPFGEFFASGSIDTDLRIWDIRKKGCIHTYKGHTRGIRTIKFTPDGRWVVTGGDDNVVKIWDLTAGKLLHDFKFHNGLISCINFHPQEFLLATGSADRTVKFWDLETFELIGSTGPEVSGVHSMIFHHDGRTLFCGLDGALKVLSWEPIRCHDIVNMGWSTLADLSVYEGKLFGCSYHRSCVAVWVADISLIEPYALAVAPKTNGLFDSIYSCEESDFIRLSGSNAISSATSTTGQLDCGNKTDEIVKSVCIVSNECNQGAPPEIDSIYASNLNSVDSGGLKKNKTTISSRITPQKLDSKFVSRVSTLNSTTFRVGKATESCPDPLSRIQSGFSSGDVSPSPETSCESRPLTPREGHNTKTHTATKVQATSRPISMPVIVPRDTADLETSVSSRKETGTTEISPGTKIHRSIHTRKPSFVGSGRESQLIANTSGSLSGIINSSEGRSRNFLSGPAGNGRTAGAVEENDTNIRHVAEKFERVVTLEQPVEDSNSKSDESICSSSEKSSVKYVRGVAVQLGKTRSLVESWERRERCTSGYTAPTSSSSDDMPKADILPSLQKGQVQSSDGDMTSADDNFIAEALLQSHDVFINVVKSRLTKLQVVRHFWEQNGIKGAIDAVAKLPDHSVHVDVISILMEKVDHFTLELFLSLLPLLAGLLSTKTERHVMISLEMLVKLLKVFGSVIRSTRSASSLVGVDLQAEQRSERCNQCFIQLEKIKESLPFLIRRGGLLEKLARGLNLALLDL